MPGLLPTPSPSFSRNAFVPRSLDDSPQAFSSGPVSKVSEGPPTSPRTLRMTLDRFPALAAKALRNTRNTSVQACTLQPLLFLRTFLLHIKMLGMKNNEPHVERR